MKKLMLMVVLVSLTSGCATYSSTYTNRNTPKGNEVQATGAAAVEAAKANTSHNCINCSSSNTQKRTQQKQSTFDKTVNKTIDSAIQTTGNSISSTINGQIRNGLDNLFN